ncbi:MAG: hypothetical protein ALECFALPRED_004618 [Alectoria fallacina]|uniref:Uncharacterized protein n=1 Tax=Alectoria fallacina TaxID=1903189 RepID=A0A8H3ISV1_9LECA|nr:MAG: hypothetical protein ALECFALPRED_004618 [Alectoria fallacina]
MRSSAIIPFSFLIASSSALVVPRQAQSIAAIAGGGPPNGPAPLNISASAIADFSGVNFLENMESAFFFQGLQNLTKWNTNHQHDHAIDVVTRVQAQELIHVQTAEDILKANNAPIFAPCKYDFPVTNAEEFFALANIITSVGIGAVINIVSGLAISDPKIVQAPASILAIEARHDAFFRHHSVSDIPNPAPFDTRISSAYALNLASPFIVKGSCAAPSFPVIPALKAEVNGKTTGSSGPITFSFDTTAVSKDDLSKGLYIGWVNQANVVNYKPATVDGEGMVKSTIPDGMAGIAFAALTPQNTAEDVNSLTAVTIGGPAPVQIS